MLRLSRMVCVLVPCALALAGAAPLALAQGSSKFERTQPAAPAPGAVAPPADPVIRELMRKAAARESEDGFCARMPPGTMGNFNDFKKKPVGATAQYNAHNAFIGKVTCGFWRIASEFRQGANRCVNLQQYHCQPGSPCEANRYAECDNGFGEYKDAKQSQTAARVDPGARNALVREIMRRAEKGENEDGFCARTNWPSVMQDIHVLAASRPYANHGKGIYCSYVVFSPETVKDGIRVKSTTNWHCSVGQKCFKTTTPFCFDLKSKTWANSSDINFCR